MVNGVQSCEHELTVPYVARAYREKNDKLINDYETYFNLADTFADMYAMHGVTTNGYETRKLLWLMTDFIRVPGLESLKNVSELMEFIGKPPTRKRK